MSLSGIRNYYVYKYEHIDELSFIRSAAYVDKRNYHSLFLQQNEPEIAELFRLYGWEGDGTVGILWLPPFVIPKARHEGYVWFVKQSNNGTAFLESPFRLEFQDLISLSHDTGQGQPPSGSPESVVHGAREGIEEDIFVIVSQLEDDLSAVGALTEASKVSGHLCERAQGQVVQSLMRFLDSCYLSILIDVISNGNSSKLKLKRGKASISPGGYLPDDFDQDINGFFTLNGLISDLWADYKFQPFNAKLNMLLRPVEFDIDKALHDEISKHVVLRNMVQHHEGVLTDKALASLGVSFLTIRSDKNEIKVERGWDIVFDLSEVKHLCQRIRDFVELFDDHVFRRVHTKLYASK